MLCERVPPVLSVGGHAKRVLRGRRYARERSIARNRHPLVRWAPQLQTFQSAEWKRSSYQYPLVSDVWVSSPALRRVKNLQSGCSHVNYAGIYLPRVGVNLVSGSSPKHPPSIFHTLPMASSTCTLSSMELEVEYRTYLLFSYVHPMYLRTSLVRLRARLPLSARLTRDCIDLCAVCSPCAIALTLRCLLALVTRLHWPLLPCLPTCALTSTLSARLMCLHLTLRCLHAITRVCIGPSVHDRTTFTPCYLPSAFITWWVVTTPPLPAGRYYRT